MNKLALFFFLIIVSTVNAQKDSLQLGDTYWEDQFYFTVMYNKFIDKPNGYPSSGFSYGLAVGYIKDIPFNRRGNWAAGIGFGYSYDWFNHGLRIDSAKNITLQQDVTSGKINLHNIEMPIQLRWRTSDAITYSFWRIYAGVRLGYNFSNTFRYEADEKQFSFKNVASYKNFQAGLELSAGYGAFNFFIYYGLTPIHNITINQTKVTPKIAKFGLIFYLL